MSDTVRSDPRHLPDSAAAASRAAVIVAFLILPWMNPFAPGPSAAIMPWLVSALCAVTVWALAMAYGSAETPPGFWVRCVAASWLAAAVCSSVIALCQYFGVASSLAPWMSTTTLGEAFGNLRQRNQFASLTAIGIAAL